MFWDGLFHSLVWTMTLVGLILLWRAMSQHRVFPSTKCFVGSMILGWGLFNFVEGLIDHHILGIHHVVERLGVSVFDYLFLASGVLLMLVGGSLVRAGTQDAAPMASTQSAWNVERRRRGGSSAREERSEALGQSDPKAPRSAESAFLRVACFALSARVEIVEGFTLGRRALAPG